MNKPKKLTLTRNTLVPVRSEQTIAEDRNKPMIKTTSICPFVCW